ncbi:hypothetical protein [Sulfuricurvum sp.]|uniref:hypothetical protein n=1 Tax=Sulfuricurvum sp. TaxID=2025608 RepID=UPI002E33B61A|nr:hypothetical protein [Sulfuricurvum sp.]HEX5330888.1 hypothetical protein [Sulfuricurvum sp.]
MKKTVIFSYLSVSISIFFVGCGTHYPAPEPVIQENYIALETESDHKVSNDNLLQSTTTKNKINEVSKNIKRTELKKNEKQKYNDEKNEEDKEVPSETIKSVGSSNIPLLKVGPKGWTVMDLSRGFSSGRLKKADVIARIREEKMLYRVFTYDEIQKLLSYKIPYKVINAMMYTAQQPPKTVTNEPAPQFPKINYLRN